MGSPDMTHIVVTGADGFLGRTLVGLLAGREGDQRITLIDRVQAACPDARFTAIARDLSAPGAMRDLVGEADVVFHLAALPGGSAEADPAASRRVNLHTSLDLIDHLSGSGARRGKRLVYASSIAVFGAPLPPRIDDATLPLPTMTYGAHKLMVETALVDANRRGSLQGVALRLPGLVARPGSGAGLRSAFMNEIFHAVIAGRPYTLPVSPQATVWLMTARRAAENLLHAGFGAFDPAARAVLTLPALRIDMGSLVAALGRATSQTPRVDYDPDDGLEAQFGRLPPLDSALARGAGYRDDGDIDALVSTVIADLAGEKV